MTRPFILNFFTALILGAVFFWALSLVPARAATCGTASWYGTEAGNRTANGERFNGTSITAAHRSLPFGTKLRVTYRGKSVVVRVNDRGPFIRGRSLDLSKAAARKIGLIMMMTEEIDEDGRITTDLQDPSGAYPETTGATETADRLYIHSLHAHAIGWLPR